MTTERRVVITGLGPCSPLGIGASPFWDALIERRNAVGPITAFDASTIPAHVAAQLPDFKITDFIPKTYRKSTKLMSRDIVIAVIAAYQAAKDAALPTKCLVDRSEVGSDGIDPARLGVNIGAGLICPDLTELGAAFLTTAGESGSFDLARWGGEGMNNLTPLWLLKFLPNMLACHVTIIHDAQAMSNTITCGEASSHLAIGEAFRNIARGAMDICICGGAESKVNPMNVVRPALMQRLALDCDDDPAGACRPFAANRTGTVVAEGGGLVVLEALDHARRRGARIYAEVAGFGAASNTHSWDQPDPRGACIALAIRNALNDASVTPGEVDLVTTFGCATALHDASEIRGWNTVFGDALGDAAALAIKGGLGNNGAGSGALDICATTMALYRNTVPPSLNTDPADPQSRFRFASPDPIDRRIDAAVTLGYALGGGQNAALVIKKYSE